MSSVDAIPETPFFGAQLKDSFKPVNAWVALGIEWLDEIQSFYRERSVIEKEYAKQTAQLCRKYHDRKARKTSTLSVGETPTMTPGSLEAASLTIWSAQLTTVESMASEREKFAAELVRQVADPLKKRIPNYEDLRRHHVEYASKLEKERDAAYADLRKLKAKYDGVCQEVDNKRKKAESAFDSNRGKAQVAYQQQIQEMKNVKNAYILAIDVTNKSKEKYYHEYLPELIDGLQDVSETRVKQLNGFWTTAAELERTTLVNQQEQVVNFLGEIPRNQPHLDSLLFTQHNLPNWQQPADFQFEPSPIWHDDPYLDTSDSSKVFLQNLLTRSKSQIHPLKREAELRKHDLKKLQYARQDIRLGRDSRNEADIVGAMFNIQEVLHTTDRKLLACTVETAIITETVGDLSITARNHNFKSQTFKIPTNCDLCGDRIWGLSAKGFDCRDCGYTCHNKCEMKVPLTCPGELTKEDKKKMKVARQETANTSKTSLGSVGGPEDGPGGNLGAGDSHQQLSRSNTVASFSSRLSSGETSVTSQKGGKRMLAPASIPPLHSSSAPHGKMLYGFQGGQEEELTVEAGRDISLVDPDDGSGWIRVRSGSQTGLVPTSYVEMKPPSEDRPTSGQSTTSATTSFSTSSTAAAKRIGPAVAPRRGGRKIQYATALYDYDARSDVEHSMRGGDRFVLRVKDSGNGWSEVEKDGVTKSVPTNYLDIAPV